MAETSDHYSRLSSGRHQHKKPTGPTGVSGSGLGVGGVPQAQRFNARLEELSGGHNLSYREQNKSLK
jgi:DNA excision repair protein ERCC-3